MQPALFHQPIPCCQRSTGQRCGLFEREALGYGNEPGLRHDAIRCEHTIEGSAQSRFSRGLCNLTIVPVLKEQACHTIAHLELRYFLADRDNLTCGIGTQNARQLHLWVIGAERDGKIPVIQAGRMEANMHLVRTHGGKLGLFNMQMIEAEAVAKAKNGAHADLDARCFA